MGNCLVTTLKGSTQNPNLPYLGEMEIKLKSSSESAAKRQFQVLTTKECKWVSDQELFSDQAHESSLGTSGILSSGVTNALYYTGAGTVKIYPKYDVNEFRVWGDSLRLNLDDFNFETEETFTLASIGGGVHGNLQGFERTFQLGGLDQGGFITAQIPITNNLKGYESMVVKSNVARINIEFDDDSFFSEFQGGDLCDILNSSYNSKIYTINSGNIANWNNAGLIISNIERLADCENIITLQTYNCPIKQGSIVTALSSLYKLTSLAVYGQSQEEDLKTVFDAWKAAGKTGSCSFYVRVGKIKVTGYTLNEGRHTVTFDAEHNWTVV